MRFWRKKWVQMEQDQAEQKQAEQKRRRMEQKNDVYDTLMDLGLEAAKGDYENAAKICLKYLKRNPKNEVMLAWMGNFRVNGGKYEKGLMYFDKALRIDPDNADVLLQKAATLYKNHQYDEALACCDRIRKTGSEISSISQLFKVQLLRERGMQHEADRCLEEEVAPNPPKDPDIACQVAFSLKLLGMKDLGLDICNTILDAQPGDFFANETKDAILNDSCMPTFADMILNKCPDCDRPFYD